MGGARRLIAVGSAAAAAATGGCLAVTLAEPTNPFQHQPAMGGGPGQQQNRVLFHKHRVILGEWPIISAFGANDRRTSTLEALFEYCAEAGYEGIEIGPSMSEFTPWFPVGTPHSERVRRVGAVAARTGIPVTGCTYCVGGRNEDVSKGCECVRLVVPLWLPASPKSFDSALSPLCDRPQPRLCRTQLLRGAAPAHQTGQGVRRRVRNLPDTPS